MALAEINRKVQFLERNPAQCHRGTFLGFRKLTCPACGKDVLLTPYSGLPDYLLVPAFWSAVPVCRICAQWPAADPRSAREAAIMLAVIRDIRLQIRTREVQP